MKSLLLSGGICQCIAVFITVLCDKFCVLRIGSDRSIWVARVKIKNPVLSELHEKVIIVSKPGILVVDVHHELSLWSIGCHLNTGKVVVIIRFF